MELLGVGPGEILLILVILLLVFGPERLPELARQAGRFVVRVRDWIQRSPDAAMILRAREDLETELQTLRAELTREVESVRQDLQNVRSDLADASKMLEQSAQEVASTSRIDLSEAGTEARAAEPSIKPPVSRTGASAEATASAVAETSAETVGATDVADSATAVDPGPIGARRARIAEVTAESPAVESAPVERPPTTIAGGETVARGARITEPAPAADTRTASADMAAIDALSKQVASIAEELARLRVSTLRRMVEEKNQPAAVADNHADALAVPAQDITASSAAAGNGAALEETASAADAVATASGAELRSEG